MGESPFTPGNTAQITTGLDVKKKISGPPTRFQTTHERLNLIPCLSFLFLNWTIIALQCCVSLCCTA